MRMSNFTLEQDKDMRELILANCNNEEIYQMLKTNIKANRSQTLSRLCYVRGLLKKEIGFVHTPVEPVEKPVEIEKPHEGVVKNESDEAKTKRLSKIQVVSITKLIPDLNYPIVAKYIKHANGHIVLFTSLRRGVVLIPGDSGMAAGHVNENFVPCTDKDCWDILNQITITFYS